MLIIDGSVQDGKAMTPFRMHEIIATGPSDKDLGIVLNFSFNPNCQIVAEYDRVYLITVRDVKVGEDITV